MAEKCPGCGETEKDPYENAPWACGTWPPREGLWGPSWGRLCLSRQLKQRDALLRRVLPLLAGIEDDAHKALWCDIVGALADLKEHADG